MVAHPCSAASPRLGWLPVFLFLCVCCLFTTGFGPPRLVDREFAPTTRVGAAELAAWAAASAPPAVSAAAALVYDVDAGRVLLAAHEEDALPPASLTKLMTALLVLEQDDLEALVTIAPEDLIGDASMGLRAGEAVTVRQLLWGLLVPSGNDAAMALARHSAGSVPAFVERMNRRAAELGLAQTRFVNPHGLDAEGHVSSAADLLTLARHAWQHALLREIVAQPAAIVAGHEMQSTNRLLADYPGVVGLKTGTTPAAGECLIAAVEDSGHVVFVVVLGSADRYADFRTLHEHYQDNYIWLHGRPAALAALNRLVDPAGALRYLAVEGEPPSLLSTRWGAPALTAYRRLALPSEAGWTAGQAVGALEWRLGDTLVATQTLALR